MASEIDDLKGETGGQLELPLFAAECAGLPMELEVARGYAEDRDAGRVLNNTVAAPEVELVAAEVLTAQCQDWLVTLNLPGAAKLVKVRWNSRLRSTAGYAAYPAWRIELNQRLIEFAGQVERTLKHELAHLIAYHRAGQRRIEPHGREWREACAALGIADESACHSLPLPRQRVERKLVYQCPACGFFLHRVRRFRRATACLHCCNLHCRGAYDERFKFELVKSTAG